MPASAGTGSASRAVGDREEVDEAGDLERAGDRARGGDQPQRDVLGARRLLGLHQDGEAGWKDVTSDEINAFLKELSGAEITAKDFRTWNATVMMAAALAEAAPPTSRTARKRVINAAYKQVSEQLGNTPAVCKASYVDPRVVDRFEDGETVAHVLRKADEAEADRDTQKVLEAAV